MKENHFHIDPNERLLSHKHVAEMVGVTPKALYHMIYDGKFKVKVFRNGKNRLYPLSEIMLYIHRNLTLVE